MQFAQKNARSTDCSGVHGHIITLLLVFFKHSDLSASTCCCQAEREREQGKKENRKANDYREEVLSLPSAIQTGVQKREEIKVEENLETQYDLHLSNDFSDSSKCSLTTTKTVI